MSRPTDDSDDHIFRHQLPVAGAQEEVGLPIPSSAEQAKPMPRFSPLAYWKQAQRCLIGWPAPLPLQRPSDA